LRSFAQPAAAAPPPAPPAPPAPGAESQSTPEVLQVADQVVKDLAYGYIYAGMAEGAAG
jgi:hypothetical protein